MRTLCSFMNSYARQVLFKMDKGGDGEELLLAKLAYADRLNLTKFTPLKFQQLCILSGCDYLESINGVGALKAAAALNRHSDVKHVRRPVATCLAQNRSKEWRMANLAALLDRPTCSCRWPAGDFGAARFRGCF